MAAIPREPTQRPTKIVSTIPYIDITRMPAEAGIAWSLNRRPSGWVPNASLFLFFKYEDSLFYNLQSYL
jgi:hypothetical protein